MTLTRTLLSCLVLLATLSAHADEGWTLTTSDFKRQSVNLRSLTDQGAKVVPYGEQSETTIPLDKLLQLDRGANATQRVRGAWTLHLATGDRIGGEPVAIANDQVTWRSPAAGELAIPLSNLRGITKGSDPAPPKFDPARTEDAVFLTNGDNVKGIVTGIEAGKIVVKQASGDALPVDLAAAKAIHFAAAAPAAAAPGRAFRVQLADGSVITAPKLDVKDSKLTLILTEGNPRPVDLTQIVLIEQLNGPVAWLSARTPTEAVYHPMFDVSFPPQMDRTYRGDRIKFQSREFARGIGVHAYTKLTYALDGEQGGQGGYKAFRTQYALSEDATKGKVTVRILLDDKVVHEAKDFPPGKLSPVILLDLGNAKTLTLEAHPGGDPTTEDRTKWHIDTQSRLNWIEPALLKEKPTPDNPKPETSKSETPTTDSPKPEAPKPETPAPETPKPNPAANQPQ